MYRSRISATISIVALLAATLTLAASTTAEAATREHHTTSHHAKTLPFKAPTTHTLAKVTCVGEDDGSWTITYVWRVRGGRYLNLGNGEHFNYRDDNVYRGGHRFIATSENVVAWGQGPAAVPTTSEATYDQWVAPIGNRSNFQHLTDSRPVNLAC